MISQQYLPCDSSTLANFKSWAQAISSFFSTAGWSQSSDTGQVNWSTISSAPGAGAYVYEVWEPNDGLTNFYVKMEYGSFTGSANSPSLRITIGTSTNGAGVIASPTIGPIYTAQATISGGGAANTFLCNFHGAPGRIAVMMWPYAGGTSPQFFAIERSLNSSGTYTSSYLTLWTNGNSGNTGASASFQGTLAFGIGVAPSGGNTSAGSIGGWVARAQAIAATNAFNNKLPFDTCSPVIGFFDFPCTVVGVMSGADVTEGAVFQTSIYGATRTYYPSKVNFFNYPFNIGAGTGERYALCMRFD